MKAYLILEDEQTSKLHFVLEATYSDCKHRGRNISSSIAIVMDATLKIYP